ncbi:MAG: hypothetical protein K2X57_07570 [Xanthobacteraceae bacterium]|nr:hypothetical protein [Xanthobacteraceae bacterium]
MQRAAAPAVALQLACPKIETLLKINEGQSPNGPLLHLEYCWSHFCMHFVPVHLELLQLTHFLSHIDARAEAGAVYQVNSSSALQVSVIRPLNAILNFLDETLLISGSLPGLDSNCGFDTG